MDNRHSVKPLKEFVIYFVTRFEEKLKNYRDEADIEGKQKAGKFNDKVINPVAGAAKSIFGATKTVETTGQLMNDHRNKAKRVVAFIGEIETRMLRHILVDASGQIFFSYQIQFKSVISRDGSQTRGMHKLAKDAVDRVMDYIDKTKKQNRTIVEINCNFITKAVILGDSKMGVIGSMYYFLIYNPAHLKWMPNFIKSSIHKPSSGHTIQNTEHFEMKTLVSVVHFCKLDRMREISWVPNIIKQRIPKYEKTAVVWKTSSLYKHAEISTVNEDGCFTFYENIRNPIYKKTLGNRFAFQWDSLEDYKSVKNDLPVSHKLFITKEQLKSDLTLILDWINKEDPLHLQQTTLGKVKQIDDDINELNPIIKSIQIDTLQVVEHMKTNTIQVNGNISKIKSTIENMNTNTIQVKADITEIKPTIENMNTVTMQMKAEVDNMAANVYSLINIEAFKNNRQKNNPIWFDIREPVTTFTGRAEVLKKLHHTLQHVAGSAVISQTASVSGLGGIGKSELSRKYAIEYQVAYEGNLIWINSETHESLKDSFVRLAEKLNIPVQDRRIELITENIYTKLGNGKSLFIFDNAEEYKIIKEFLPFSLPSDIQKPHILITSRNQNWELADTGVMDVINLEYFTPEEAFDFIKNALKVPLENNSSDADIKNLAEELDYFPLALGQAVAYIKMKNVRAKRYGTGRFNVSDYVKAYKESLKSELLEHRHENSQYNKTVLTTWNVTLKNIENENEDSIKIIEIMAYLVPDLIKPDKIFCQLIKDKKKREDAIDVLLKYSMINIKNRLLSIHRIVQEVIRLKLKDKRREKDVLDNALELLGFNLYTGNDIHLISVWSYACDYGQIIDEFFFKYIRHVYKTTPFPLIVKSDNIDAVKNILTHFKKSSNEKIQGILNSADYYHGSSLFIPIWQNNLAMVKLLIEFGAENDTKTCAKAIFNGQIEIVQYIYPNNDEYLQNAKFYSALKSGNVESLNNLLKVLTNEQIQNIMELKLTNVNPKLIDALSPLYIAGESGNLDMVKLFVNYNADINFGDNYGTPLIIAATRGHYEIMKFLIENGANCNAVDCFGNTVLHAAAINNHLELVKYLINSNKCDLYATNEDGDTVLHLATKYARLEVVEYIRNIINDQI